MAVKKSELSNNWAHHIEQFRASGMTRVAYCHEHGLKVHQLGYYIGRANRSKHQDKKGTFARVAIAGLTPARWAGGARLCFGNGVSLEVEASPDPIWIAQVIAAVGGQR